MNKLLLLALLGCAYLAVTECSQTEEEGSVMKVEGDLMESRVVRSADPEPGKKKNKAKKGRKKKNKKAKKGGKKGRKAKKGKKSRKGKKGNKTKKGRKARKGKKGKKGRKGKKKGKKAKKGKKKSKKGGKKGKKSKKSRKGKKSGSVRQSCAADSECLSLAEKYIRTVKDKVTNFQKQKKRIEKFDKVSSNKGGKKGNFDGLKNQLVEAAGGNASKIMCQGSDTSEGAKKLKEVFKVFDECNKGINSSCNTGAPEYNKAEAATCDTDMTSFSKAVGKCEELKGAEACKCWKDPALDETFKKIIKCDLSAVSKKFASFKTECTKSFAKCRGSNQDAADVIFACSKSNSPDKLLGTLKNAKANKAALENLSAAAKKAASRTRIRTARALSCSDYAPAVKKVADKAKKAPTVPAVAKEAKELADAPPSSCSAAEKAALSAAASAVDEGVAAVAEVESATQAALETLTGTTASSSAIDSATATRRFKRRGAIESMLA